MKNSCRLCLATLFLFCVAACQEKEPPDPTPPAKTCIPTAAGTLYLALDFDSPNFNSRFSQAYEYDGQGRLSKLFINTVSDTARRYALLLERDAQGRMTKAVTKNQGILTGFYYTFAYSGAGSSPTNFKLMNGNAVVVDSDIEYDSARKPTRLSEKSSACSCTFVFGYEYDQRGNPIRAKENPGQSTEVVLREYKSFDDKTNPFSLNPDVQFLQFVLHRIPFMANNPLSWLSFNSVRPSNGKGYQFDITYTYNQEGQPITFKGTGVNLGFPDQKTTGDVQSFSYTCK